MSGGFYIPARSSERLRQLLAAGSGLGAGNPGSPDRPIVWAKCTGAISGSYYPGEIDAYVTPADTWNTLAMSVQLKAVGATLENGRYYLATPAGPDGAGNPTFAVLADAGEYPAASAIYYGGLVNTTTQVIKGDKVFRDRCFWQIQDVIGSPVVPYGESFSSVFTAGYMSVYPHSGGSGVVGNRGVMTSSVTSGYTASSVSFADDKTGYGGSAALFAQATSACVAFIGGGSGGRVGVSGQYPAGLCSDTDFYLVGNLDAAFVDFGQENRKFGVYRIEGGGLVLRTGIDHDFGAGEYPIVRGGIVVGIVGASPPPPPIPPPPPPPPPKVPPPPPRPIFGREAVSREYDMRLRRRRQTMGVVLTVSPASWSASVANPGGGSQAFTVSGGTAPYAFASVITPGGRLSSPDLTANPIVYNTTGATGVATITTTVTDANGLIGIAVGTVTVS